MLIAVSRREGFRGHRASVRSRLDKFKEASVRQVWLHCAKLSIGGRGGREGGKVVVVEVVVVVGHSDEYCTGDVLLDLIL